MNRKKTQRRFLSRIGRRGIASVLAMLFLVLFSTLAVGFYAATGINVQIAKNERALSLAQSAADGGMQFIRYQLGQFAVSPTTTSDQYLNVTATNLATQMNPTTNMAGNTVQISGTGVNAAIYLPSQTGWMPLDKSVGTQFRVMIQQSGVFLVVTVDGSGPNSTLKRAIQLTYQFSPKAGAILNYGVASAGTVQTGGATIIKGLTSDPKGSVLSADVNNSTPINIGGKEVSGDLSIVQGASANVLFGGAEIGGSTDPTDINKNHIHRNVTPPTFPTVDTSMFTKYATTAYTSGQSTYNNVYIPPNTNPKFTAGTQINGVLYVQAPNVVTFRGGVTITGVIVTDPSAKYDPVNNVLNFAGNVTANPISSLPTATFGTTLPTLTGSFILAPAFYVTMTGDFGTVSGSIVAGQVNMSGNSGGTVQGSVIALVDNATGGSPSVYMNGSAQIDIASTGTSQFPTGLVFGDNFTPAPGSYLEVTPW
jgi:Tfp pilus assembly protein PilX